MSWIARLAVLVAALASLFAVTSASAGATTWTNTGDTSIHAVGGGGTLHVGASGHLVCTGATATGTAPTDSTGAVVTGHVVFTPCNVAGQNTFVTCNYTLTGTGFASPVSAAVTCDARLETSGVGPCHISGSTGSTYTNPTFDGGSGTLTLVQSTTLTVSHFGPTSCPLGTGTGKLTHQSLTTTSGFTPIISTP